MAAVATTVEAITWGKIFLSATPQFLSSVAKTVVSGRFTMCARTAAISSFGNKTGSRQMFACNFHGWT